MPFRIESRPLFTFVDEDGEPGTEMGPWEDDSSILGMAVDCNVFAGKEEAEKAMGDLIEIGFDPDRLRVVEVEA